MKTRTSAPNKVVKKADLAHFDQIIKDVMTKHQVARHELFDTSLHGPRSRARAELCYRAWEETDLTGLKIADLVGCAADVVKRAARRHELRLKGKAK